MHLRQTRKSLNLGNNKYFVSNTGIVDEWDNRPDYVSFVILAKYILLCPDQAVTEKEWVSFKDFKKAAAFSNTNYFTSDTERAIEKYFSGRLDELTKACKALNGSPPDMAVAYDLSFEFPILPRISLLLLFNDGDDEFPATCKVLFEKQAEHYLDPESLAMTGACLAKKMKQQAPSYCP